MNIKKYLAIATVALVALGTAVSANAQKKDFQGKRGERQHMTQEQRVELKANRLAEELALDDAKRAEFTKLYKQYETEMADVMKKYMPERFQPRDTTKKFEPKTLTDAEVEKQILDRFAMSRATLDIREKYYKLFRKSLSPKQIQKIYDNERGELGRMKMEKERRAFGKGAARGAGKPFPQKDNKSKSK